jgi:DNA-binding response OmpR family regulator
MEEKKILIIDEDQKLIVKLKDKLTSLGYSVSTAINGVIALQKILNNQPDLVIMELDLKIIGGKKISQIVRANPKLAEIPFFFLSSKQVEIATFNKAKDSLILKPFNFHEIFSKIDAHFNKLEEKTPESLDLKSEISGHLSQISLFDLLQVFHMNRKSGRLIIKFKDKNGIIFVKNGDVINAQIDKVEGEKAFYRLMTLKEERFNFLPEEFLPEDSVSIPKITKKPDNLLMEGLRQLDEWREMKDNLPDINSTVKLKVDPSTLAKGLKSITKEIFVLMEFYSKVKDIVDGCSFTDYEVLKTLYVLLQKGIIEESAVKKRETEKVLFLTPEQLMKIKKRLLETKSFRTNRKFEKILVMAEDFKSLKKIIQMFLLLKEFSINQKDLISSPEMEFLGILGRLNLTDEMSILFYSIPIKDDFKPLWNAFSQDVMGVLLLMPQNGSKHVKDIKNTYNFFNVNLKKIVKPILITDDNLTDSELGKMKKNYDINEIFNYNVNDQEGVRNFFANLLIEIL